MCETHATGAHVFVWRARVGAVSKGLQRPCRTIFYPGKIDFKRLGGTLVLPRGRLSHGGNAQDKMQGSVGFPWFQPPRCVISLLSLEQRRDGRTPPALRQGPAPRHRRAPPTRELLFEALAAERLLDLTAEAQGFGGPKANQRKRPVLVFLPFLFFHLPDSVFTDF